MHTGFLGGKSGGGGFKTGCAAAGGGEGEVVRSMTCRLGVSGFSSWGTWMADDGDEGALDVAEEGGAWC